jgi:mono/diheme cytochrome c family protein
LLGVSRSSQAAALSVEWGPIKGVPSTARSVSLTKDLRRQIAMVDAQDGQEHHVRGVSLLELLKQVKAPKAVDAVVFVYADGMRIPVKLRDTAEVDAIFIAFEHGDVRERFNETYAIQNRFELPCPKVVYGKKLSAYSPWFYPTELKSIRLVTWAAYEAQLAQPTRRVSDRSGWGLYLAHCQTCHGIGGQGATRGPDFLGHMDAYRRVPPLAVTDEREHPSLHEKVKGFTEGTMPVMNHVSSKDIGTLWRWLHHIHDSSKK